MRHVCYGTTSRSHKYLEPVRLRLRDADGDVRQAALAVLLSVAMEKLGSLAVETYDELIERMKDKRGSIRSACRIGLSKIYSHYIYGVGVGIVDEEEALMRLRRIPGYVLCSFGYPDTSEKHGVIQVHVINSEVEYNVCLGVSRIFVT